MRSSGMAPAVFQIPSLQCSQVMQQQYICVRKRGTPWDSVGLRGPGNPVVSGAFLSYDSSVIPQPQKGSPLWGFWRRSKPLAVSWRSPTLGKLIGSVRVQVTEVFLKDDGQRSGRMQLPKRAHSAACVLGSFCVLLLTPRLYVIAFCGFDDGFGCAPFDSTRSPGIGESFPKPIKSTRSLVPKSSQALTCEFKACLTHEAAQLHHADHEGPHDMSWPTPL